MTVKVIEKFSHNNLDYQVRVCRDNNDIYVKVFEESTKKPADGYTYSVTIETQVDAKVSNAFIDPISDLINIAKEAVRSGMWENYIRQVIEAEEEKKKKSEK